MSQVASTTSTPPQRARRRAPVVLLAAGAATGIVLERFGITTLGFGYWWAVATLLLAMWYLLHHLSQAWLAGACLLATIAALAGGWHHWHWRLYPTDEVGLMATLEPYPCCFEAIADAAPERMAAAPDTPYRAIPQGEKSQLLLHVVRIRDGEHWTEASGRCELIVDGHLQGVGAGDRLRVFGEFRAPSPARNPGQFDYALHSRASRELCFMRSGSPDCVTVLSEGSSWWPERWIDSVRHGWERQLWRLLGPERAPTAAALLLGSRNTMPREAIDAYRVTGALHVLVVSGMHVGILMSLVLSLLGMGWLPRRQALLIAIVIVVFYTLLTGAQPPVVRAAVLTVLLCLGLWYDNQPFAINSLGIAAVVVLVLNPSDLFQAGTQLSFLCVAVLMWFASVKWLAPLSPLQFLLRSVEPWYQRVARIALAWAGWTVAATLAVWIVSLPLLLQQYNLVSPIAIVMCVPVFLVVGWALYGGVAMLTIGWLVPPLERPLAWLTGSCIDALNQMVNSTSQWPYAYAWTPAPSLWWVLGWYVLMPVLLAAGGFRFGWSRTVQIIALWIAIGTLPAIAARFQHRDFQATFLDVGHGICVVVTTPEGATLLYDAGSLGSGTHAADAISGYLWSRGIRTIDGLVLSHADIDHFNAVPGLVDRFRIGRVFATSRMFPPIDDNSDHSAPAELQRTLIAHGIPIEIVELGDRLTLDATTHADVIYPDHLGNLGSDNANSLVLAVEFEGRRILLPGDLEAPGIDFVMAEPPLDTDVLLAPHHGSKNSDPPGFAAWSTPETVVVSGGPATVDPNVAASYRDRGAQILYTAKSGAVTVHIRDKVVDIDNFLP
ncbi:ComEC/Rec2 family competence protein [Aeoliella sp. SH292]|uniref:ComEC/Rec2 family competence protein n=1 Tax=Aeoliella sp. SH292 TaxID=3454464 RepID=UPI003F99CF4F